MLRKTVLLPPLALLIAGLVASILNEQSFLKLLQAVVDQLIGRLDWLFNWSTFLLLIVVIAAYVSPLGNRRIGGPTAQPLLSKSRWFAITLCTTIATGILFWGTAEPIFHLRDYPLPGSPDPAFAMSMLFYHWTIIPYAIYTVAGLSFALAYYNHDRSFSLSSMLFSLREKEIPDWLGGLVDSVCLFSLVAGMAASLGAGIITLSGGLENINLKLPANTAYAWICLAIVITFVLSAASGLQRGIRWLSGFNFLGFVLIAIIVLFFSPVSELLGLATAGFTDFTTHFLSRSTNIGDPVATDWKHDWNIFNWANWYAWAPITALFLGRLAVGYTVREFIRVNWLFPSLFGAGWMIIFGGSAILTDVRTGGSMQLNLTENGPESLIYELLNALPASGYLTVLLLILVFLSYVTAADSNISAMSGLSVRGIDQHNPEAPIWVKIIWGLVIGTVSWTMISFAGVDGIRLTSIIGGVPAMFLIIFVGIGLTRWVILSWQSTQNKHD